MFQYYSSPILDDLRSLSEHVPSFPITAKQLIQFARSINSPLHIIEFYKAFPHDETFHDRNDLWNRSELVELMEEQDEPFEMLLSPEG